MNTEEALFTKFFTDLSNNNPDKCNELVKFSKDVINGTLDKRIIHLTGTGSNGKSTLMNILREYTSCSCISLDSLYDDDLMEKCNGKCLIINEPEDCDISRFQPRLKLFIGGDKVYGNGKEYLPNHTFIIVTNSVISCHESLKRRMRTITMDAVFNESADNDIFNKMMTNKDLLKEFILR